MYQSFTYQVSTGDRTLFCRDLSKALSAIVFNEGSVTASVKQTVVVEFQTAHELIGDILRNHTNFYKLVAIYCDSCDEMTKATVMPKIAPSEAIEWILNHMNELDECRYSFNRSKQEGIYVLGCDVRNLSRNAPVCYRLEEIN